MQLDAGHNFLLGKFPAAAIPATERNLVSVLLQCLVEENFKFLLVRELIDVAAAGSDRGAFECTLLLLGDLPEPLVNLVFLQAKLFGQLHSHLARRDAALVPLEDLVEDVHLVGVFAVAISGERAADGVEERVFILIVHHKVVVNIWEEISFVEALGNGRIVLLEPLCLRCPRAKRWASL